MGHPDVLFLVLDSVRADRVSTYGHSRATTPNLDAFAERATMFEHAFSPSTWTLPSHTSMFTGLAPTEHGVTNWFADRPNGLPSNLEPVAERLADRGYRTAGFSNNPWVGTLSGLDRGFDEFVEWDLEISRSGDDGIHDRGDRIHSRLHSLLGLANRQPIFLLKRRFFTARLIERAVEWLESTAGDDRPTFTFLNLMEAHSPYFPPRSAFQSLGLSPPGPVEPRVLNTKFLAYVMGHTGLPPDRRERVLEYYDASIRYQDRKVGEVLRTLRSSGRFDDTLVIVCSDHGKTLGEVDRDAVPPHYTRSINTDVPLLVSAPDQRAGRRVAEPAELTGLHDLVLADDTTPEAALTTDGFALVEDYSPHSGREESEITCWRVLADGQYRYIRCEDGRAYLYRNGSQVEDTPTFRRWLDDALDERIERLEPLGGAGEYAPDIGAALEGQLSDLGYLE